MAKITVVGSINIDLVTRVKRSPAEGETVFGDSFSAVPGGKGANQAVCAARLGARVQMIGRVGDDLFAAQLRSALAGSGVDTQGVRTVEGPSGTAVITVAHSGANSIVVVPGANEALQPASLDEHLDALRESNMVLTQLETPIATGIQLGAFCAQFAIPLMLDPAPAQSLPAALLSKVTWLTPNEPEACSLLRELGFHCGEQLHDASLARAAECLLTGGARNVILKLGERGVFLMGKDVDPVLVPPYRVCAVDTTAAGDAFNGGFAYAITQRSMDPVSAARFACAVAACCVTRAGAQAAMPDLEEVEELMRRSMLQVKG